MPLYCYLCTKCGEQYEILKPIAHMDKHEDCPACKIPLTRQITSPPSIQFKGPGFFVNDYPKKGSKRSDE
jgi:putative FmdB family regulatory protein